MLPRSTIRRLSAISLLLLLVSGAGCSAPEQLGPDEGVLNEVDALYTAVTSRRPELLDASWSRLEALHEEQRIPDAAFDELGGIVSLAREDQWQPAAEQLWTFIRGQQRV